MTKPCIGCGVERTAHNSYFNKTRQRLHSRCKECHTKQNVKSAQANPQAGAERCRRYNQRNLEARRKQKAMSQGKRRQRGRKPPPWFNKEEVASVYLAASFCRALGIDVQVDHIVPLLGRNVCGLHVQNNLRVTLTHVNRKKGNRLLPGV